MIHSRYNLERVQKLVGISLAGQWLSLHEGKFRAEVNRNVRFGETDVCEQWSEPTVGFYYSFKHFIVFAVRQVWQRPQQQAPAGLRSRRKPTPNLHKTRLCQSAQEAWRTGLKLQGRMLVEMVVKAWERLAE